MLLKSNVSPLATGVPLDKSNCPIQLLPTKTGCWVIVAVQSAGVDTIEACIANEPRATNGSPVIKAKNSSKKIINYAKVINTLEIEKVLSIDTLM